MDKFIPLTKETENDEEQTRYSSHSLIDYHSEPANRLPTTSSFVQAPGTIKELHGFGDG